jgi:serine-type D-Ala-D-Ala carboxypeptidase/endopeptidase
LQSDREIHEIIVERIDRQHQSVGIVVGVIGPEGRRVIAHGNLEKGDPRPLNGDTIFEIASVTKVFTSLLLADMVERGEVALNDPIAKYLPEAVKVPERNGKQITFLNLATHTSGLPPLPTNMAFRSPKNPYADYSVEQMYEFLSTYQLTRDIGSQYEYSNLSGGLLGHVLALREGTTFEVLVKQRICAPLGMTSTGITLTPEMEVRLAAGHNSAMETVESWGGKRTLAGAGALRSSANDMLAFVAANLCYTNSPLALAMASMLKERRPTGQPGVEVALGWHISKRNDKEIVWHNGGTGGYRAYVGFDPEMRIGVVALSNAMTPAGVDDIGWHLLDPSFPLAVPPKEREQVSVNPDIFDGYVGVYHFTPRFAITIIRDGDHLYAQATNQARHELFPESGKDFFLKAVNAQVTFVTDGEGRATELILHQAGRDQHAKRTE